MGAKHEKVLQTAKTLKEFLAEHNWTQAAMAKKIDVSTSVISQFLKGSYKGDVDGLSNKILNLIESISRKDRRIKNKPFIETSVAKDIQMLISQTEAFSDDEGKIGLIIGDGGHGKSHCMRQYANVNKNTVYVELDDAMNQTMVFNAIADKLGIFASGSLAAVTRRVIENIQNRHIIIMLDEASSLKVKQLNQLRQVIVVKGRSPLILAGNSDLYKTVMQSTTRKGYESLDQFTSRLMGVLNLDNKASDKDGGLYTVSDVRKLYEYGGVRLTKDGVGALRKICKTPRSGRLRTCSHIVAALHTSGVIAEVGQISAEYIMAAIEQLDLPVKARLPFNLAEDDAESQSESLAMTA